jgi:hypothetical protein
MVIYPNDNLNNKCLPICKVTAKTQKKALLTYFLIAIDILIDIFLQGDYVKSQNLRIIDYRPKFEAEREIFSMTVRMSLDRGNNWQDQTNFMTLTAI